MSESAYKEAEILAKGNAASVALEALSGAVDELRKGFYLQFQEVTSHEDFLRVQSDLKALNSIEKKLQQSVAKSDNIVTNSKRKRFEPLKPLDSE